MTDKRLWVYHAEHKPMIILRPQLAVHFDDGWRESPAECAGYTTKIKDAIDVFADGQFETNKAKGHEITKEHARKLAIDEIGRHQTTVTDALNDTINDKAKLKAAKKDLEKEIIKKFGVDPDMRKFKGVQGLQRLEELYRELENGNS